MEMLKIVLFGTFVVAVAGVMFYQSGIGAKNRAELGAMLSTLAREPTRVIEGGMGDVALCWYESDASLLFVSSLSGSMAEIQKDEVHSIELHENGLLVQHKEDVNRKLTVDEEMAKAASNALPVHLRDNIERLEIVVGTKSGIPALGYRIPVIETETSISRDYKTLRNELVASLSVWRSAMGI